MYFRHSCFLLDRALSRSDKKVLHVDKNPYYGGPEAAFSLPEAQDWATKVNEGMFVRAWRFTGPDADIRR